jgi:hypothetical protein
MLTAAMDIVDALPFVEALACGTDPITGDALPGDSPLHHPQVIRALFMVTRLLESQCANVSDAEPTKPMRAGEPWKEDEDQKLLSEFQSGIAFTQIATNHQRTRRAIVSRLVRLGYIRRKSTKQITTSSACDNDAITDDKWWRRERPRSGKPWTEREDAELRNLVGSGMTIREIARHLQRGEHAVDVRRSKLGLG